MTDDQCKFGFRAPELGPHPACPQHSHLLALTDEQLAEIERLAGYFAERADADLYRLVGENVPVLIAEVKRLRSRLRDFEDGHIYTKLRREADYWQAHHEGDRRHAETLILGHLADRDRARDRAVALEQQNSSVRALAQQWVDDMPEYLNESAVRVVLADGGQQILAILNGGKE